MILRIFAARGINSHGQLAAKTIPSFEDFEMNMFFTQFEIRQVAAHFGITYVFCRDFESNKNRLFRIGTGLRYLQNFDELEVDFEGFVREPPLFSMARVKQALGLSMKEKLIREIRIPEVTQEARIVAGLGCLYFLSGGEVWAAGDNTNGKLGLCSNNGSFTKFQKIKSQNAIVDLKAGGDFMIFLDGEFSRPGTGIWKRRVQRRTNPRSDSAISHAIL